MNHFSFGYPLYLLPCSLSTPNIGGGGGEGASQNQQAAGKVIFSGLLKKGQMVGSRNPEE